MNHATRITVTSFGIFVGLMGIEHGLGEILQGSQPPPGVMILSWPDAPFFAVLNGEPAMTILPNLLLSGVLAVLSSLVFLALVTRFIARPGAGWAIILACLPMLLFGAGIFPPLIGVLLGVSALRIHAPRVHAPLRGWRKRMWPGTLIAGILTWLLMFPGLPVLDYFFGVQNLYLTVATMAGMFLLLFAALLSGFAYDMDQRGAVEDGPTRSAARQPARPAPRGWG